MTRSVALKEIQSQFAGDADSRRRFVVEAEITGGLEHPGIVPVYGLGTYDDGRPFYAMRFVKGDNLRQAIRRFHGIADSGSTGPRTEGECSLAFRELLGRFVDVCNAVAYAHGRGVLHRDLKPGNVMLGRYGETLLVDWGLAKPFGQTVDPTVSEPPLKLRSCGSTTTEYGHAVGTPAYMSPEQASGRLDQLGPATDIYSLGATLYELLAGQAPFPTLDLDSVQKGVFPPPRQVRVNVPQALEAVCLKALALRPADRYGSAEALAADVERWLADEPVSAYREPLSVRVRRWGRRHRPLVTGAATLLVMAVVLLVVLNIHSERARLAVEREQKQTAAERDAKEEERKKADMARIEAEKQRDRALYARKHTREALDAMVSGVTGDALTVQKEISAEQKKFLESVLKYYEEFAAEPGEDREGRERLAKAHFSLGLIRYRLGQSKEGATVFARTVELYSGLAADFPAVPDYRQNLAGSHNNLGALLVGLGQRPEAASAHRAALALREKLAADFPDVPNHRLDLADSRLGLADLLARSGDHAKAAAEAEILAEAKDVAAGTLYDAACVLALSSAAAKDDATIADRYAVRAVTVLRQSFVKGFTNIAHMLQDSDLAPLRRRADYFDLLWDLADMPALQPAERR